MITNQLQHLHQIVADIVRAAAAFASKLFSGEISCDIAHALILQLGPQFGNFCLKFNDLGLKFFICPHQCCLI